MSFTSKKKTLKNPNKKCPPKTTGVFKQRKVFAKPCLEPLEAGRLLSPNGILVVVDLCIPVVCTSVVYSLSNKYILLGGSINQSKYDPCCVQYPLQCGVQLFKAIFISKK
jgi:hypothetical protein